MLNATTHSTFNIHHSTLNIAAGAAANDRGTTTRPHLGPRLRPLALVLRDQPQARRDAVHRHRVLLSHRRRHRSGADALPAFEAGKHIPLAGYVQPAFHHAWDDDA